MCSDLRVSFCTFQFHFRLTTKDLPAFTTLLQNLPKFSSDPAHFVRLCSSFTRLILILLKCFSTGKTVIWYVKEKIMHELPQVLVLLQL